MHGIFSLAGKTVLVTGASSGLGRHFARALGGVGARVALAARRAGQCSETAADIVARGGRAFATELDVTDPESVRRSVEAVEAELGPIDVLVNNAGIAIPEPILELTDSTWRQVIDTNLGGAFRVAQTVARRMVVNETRGSIINIASVWSFMVAKQLVSYAAAKAGLVQVTKTMALELAAQHIRVNAIAPGYIETDMNLGFFQSEAGARLIKRIPQRQLGKPEDLDGALFLLASDAGRYMTGSVILVDGGLSLACL
jgi:NAD(P)-dependent dehydrogenase (short-subunit alcohol dehydrogenase family)